MGSDDVKGRMSLGNAPSEAFRTIRSSKSGYYSGLETTIATGRTNDALTALVGGSDFFTGLPGGRANYFEIYSDVDVTVRFRTDQNAGTTTANLKPIRVKGNTYREVTFIADCTELYFTNASGATANLEVIAI